MPSGCPGGKNAESLLRLLGDIDLALTQALQQLIGATGQSARSQRRHRGSGREWSPHARAGDLGDSIVKTFQMLDIDRGIHVDTAASNSSTSR